MAVGDPTAGAFPRVVEPLVIVVLDVPAGCLQEDSSLADPVRRRGVVLGVVIEEVGDVTGGGNRGGGGDCPVAVVGTTINLGPPPHRPGACGARAERETITYGGTQSCRLEPSL